MVHRKMTLKKRGRMKMALSCFLKKVKIIVFCPAQEKSSFMLKNISSGCKRTQFSTYLIFSLPVTKRSPKWATADELVFSGRTSSTKHKTPHSHCFKTNPAYCTSLSYECLIMSSCESYGKIHHKTLNQITLSGFTGIWDAHTQYKKNWSPYKHTIVTQTQGLKLKSLWN